MTYKISSAFQTQSNDRLDRIALGNYSHTLEGGGVVWDVDSVSLATAATITVMHYDQARYGEYCWGGKGTDRKPHIIIRGSANFTTYNVEVQDEDGNVLFTFEDDCSSVPKYAVLRLTTGNRNTVSWELA